MSNDKKYYKFKTNEKRMAILPSDEYFSAEESKLWQEITEKEYESYMQIAHLKAELAKTDYQAIKHSEGWISEEDYAPIKAARQELRDQINELEAQL